MPRAPNARAADPRGSSSTGNPAIPLSLKYRSTEAAPPRSDDSGSTTALASATNPASFANSGISFTHGTHHVAQKFNTTPLPR